MDYNERPYIVIWETTQACDLACAHCRACARPRRDAAELSTDEARRLIDEIAALEAPVFVLTGGDPLKRPDIFDLVEYATCRGVRTSMTPSATPLLTREAIAALKQCGLVRLAVSLDGSTAPLHDGFRGWRGSYHWTLCAIRWAGELGLPVQVNTTITRRNLTDVEAMIGLLATLEIVLWSVFFLVPVGRGQVADLISAEEFETVFQQLYEASLRVGFDVKTTEAPHYRRFALQRRAEELRQSTLGSPAAVRTGGRPGVTGRLLQDAVLAGLLPDHIPDRIARAPRGLNDGKGFVFISHRGEVYPSGFLPVSAGNVREQPLADIYRHSPLFVALRDSTRLGGKCGVCEFREICGGSRARAFAITGDPFAQEPRCSYVPRSPGIPKRQPPHEPLEAVAE